MSNEWSSSVGNLVVGERMVNHQWSKGEAFEAGFRAVLAAALGGGSTTSPGCGPTPSCSSPSASPASTGYHRSFQSCNRGFHIDPAQRLDHWCGECDKCCFIDLILAPFLDAATLAEGVRRAGAARRPRPAPRFEDLVGTSGDAKPWECVGDVDECRAAVALAPPVPTGPAARCCGRWSTGWAPTCPRRRRPSACCACGAPLRARCLRHRRSPGLSWPGRAVGVGARGRRPRQPGQARGARRGADPGGRPAARKAGSTAAGPGHRRRRARRARPLRRRGQVAGHQPLRAEAEALTARRRRPGGRAGAVAGGGRPATESCASPAPRASPRPPRWRATCWPGLGYRVVTGGNLGVPPWAPRRRPRPTSGWWRCRATRPPTSPPHRRWWR